MNSSIVQLRSWNGRAIRQREDGYMCLTDMAYACDKKFGHWNETKSTKSYLETLSGVVGLCTTDLIEIIQGGVPEKQGTWGHPAVAEEFWKWLMKREQNPNKPTEKEVKDKLAFDLNGITEVPCKTGFIDILTRTQVIEVKTVKSWKFAIGQVLVYQLEYPKKKPRIHLYGEASEEMKQMIVSYSARLNILVSFESQYVGV